MNKITGVLQIIKLKNKETRKKRPVAVKERSLVNEYKVKLKIANTVMIILIESCRKRKTVLQNLELLRSGKVLRKPFIVLKVHLNQFCYEI